MASALLLEAEESGPQVHRLRPRGDVHAAGGVRAGAARTSPIVGKTVKRGGRGSSPFRIVARGRAFASLNLHCPSSFLLWQSTASYFGFRWQRPCRRLSSKSEMK